MKTKKTVILIRHGKTSYNALGKYMGCGIDEDISPDGKDEIIGKRDKIRAVCDGAVIYTGPLKRAKSTAQLIFYDKDINVCDSLIEIDFGDFEGKSADELKDDRRYRQWIESDGTLTFPNGESISGFKRRTMTSLHNIVNNAGSAQKIAIVCHGGNIMAIMSCLAGGSYYDYLIPNVDGYVIDLAVEDERISYISHDRIGSCDNT